MFSVLLLLFNLSTVSRTLLGRTFLLLLNLHPTDINLQLLLIYLCHSWAFEMLKYGTEARDYVSEQPLHFFGLQMMYLAGSVKEREECYTHKDLKQEIKEKKGPHKREYFWNEEWKGNCCGRARWLKAVVMGCIVFCLSSWFGFEKWLYFFLISW